MFKTKSVLALSLLACVACVAWTGSSAAAEKTPAPPPAAAQDALPGDIVDRAGRIVPAAYTAMAARLSEDAGIAYRYGAAAPASITVSDRWPQGVNRALTGNYSSGDHTTYYQVGGPQNRAFDDYSSNQAQVAFVADSRERVGVSLLETLAMRENTFTESPGLSWTTGFVGLDDPNVVAYKASAPTALGRCYGRPTWCVNSMIGFQSGLIGIGGSNTAMHQATVQLEPGSVPTAIAVTNGGEFGLVTVWDTVHLRGRLAIIALSEKGGQMWSGVVVPGMPNFGNWSFLKIVGYVELPDMKAPTDVSVTTGLTPEGMHRLYGIAGFPDFADDTEVDLRTPSTWRTFAAGGRNAGTVASSGMAVVISKSERKATFIDLKPLFDFYRSSYFGKQAAAFTELVDKKTGMAPDQWPYAFSVQPSQTPKIVKTVSLASPPTAVKVALWDSRRAWIATQDGHLHIYSIGPTPGAITQVGSVPVGSNPTHIAYDKHDMPDGLIVVSRGERKIQWLSMAGDSGRVVRTLRDQRLVDPVAAEDNDNHGTESYVLSVADYGGRQLANYRFGPVIFRTNGGGACQPPDGCGMAGRFEFGGAFALPGKPFAVTGANVP